MIDIPLGKALVAEESRHYKQCKDCIFHKLHMLCNSFTCTSTRREDGKNVIFKLVDLPGEETHEDNKR